MLFFRTFYSSNKTEKTNIASVSQKNKKLSSITIFNIDNTNKCFLSIKPAQTDFWSNDAENTALITLIQFNSRLFV